MSPDELSKITEKGLKELDLEWPMADSLYELKIPRLVYYPMKAEPTRVTNHQEYLDFLYFNVFPLIDQLEKDACIVYWHILNHDNLDLRLSIQDENQLEGVEGILAKHAIAHKPLTKWGTYDDPNLGSRFGCQALLLLYNAQSKFVRNLVRSIFWLRAEDVQEELSAFISSMTTSVPIYTSHMLLNIFPADTIYEVSAHLNEGEFRFRNLLERGGLPREAEKMLGMVQNANQGLRNLLKK